MSRFRSWVVLVSLLGMALIAAPVEAASGVKGTTMVWQYQPIPIDGLTHYVGALVPLVAQIEVYSVRTGRIVTTAVSDTQGRFRVPLRPGRYRLLPKTIYFGPHSGDLAPIVPRLEAAPLTIRVLPGSFKKVQIIYHLNTAV